MTLLQSLLGGHAYTCCGCGGDVTEPIHGLCRRCAETIPWLGEVCCKVCGRDVDCPDCTRWSEHGFVRNRSAVRYEQPIIDWMARYKYRGDEELSALFGDMLELALMRLQHEFPKLRRTPAAVTYIPLSKERTLERGFNQTEQMAARLASLCGFPVFPLLSRTKHTEKQSFKTRRDREESLRGVFALRRDGAMKLYQWATKQKTRPVLVLIDDIYTTGSTLREASRTIRSVVPLSIYCLTAARS